MRRINTETYEPKNNNEKLWVSSPTALTDWLQVTHEVRDIIHPMPTRSWKTNMNRETIMLSAWPWPPRFSR